MLKLVIQVVRQKLDAKKYLRSDLWLIINENIPNAAKKDLLISMHGSAQLISLE